MTERKWYIVTLDGCDDSTAMDFELTPTEAALITKLCEQSEEVSTYGCMPTMSIKEGSLIPRTPHYDAP